MRIRARLRFGEISDPSIPGARRGSILEIRPAVSFLSLDSRSPLFEKNKTPAVFDMDAPVFLGPGEVDDVYISEPHGGIPVRL